MFFQNKLSRYLVLDHFVFQGNSLKWLVIFDPFPIIIYMYHLCQRRHRFQHKIHRNNLFKWLTFLLTLFLSIVEDRIFNRLLAFPRVEHDFACWFVLVHLQSSRVYSKYIEQCWKKRAKQIKHLNYWWCVFAEQI